ncbi:MAG: hypothetical protein JST22_16100 [Bacteroidetes bacterium]|nr:hypothetical protein [Bacteroidota bacterium]
MKTIITTLVTVVAAFGICAANPPADQPELRIYHIAVGQGDCTLIVIKDNVCGAPNTYKVVSILIDAGPISDAVVVGRVLQGIKDTIKAAGGDGLQYIVASHLHSDHLRGIYSILLALKKSTDPDYAWKSKVKLIDRIGYSHFFSYKMDKCWNIANGRTRDAYKTLTTTGAFKGQHLVVKSKDDILKPFKLAHSSMVCISSNGEVNGSWVAQTKAGSTTEAKSENDLSFSFYLRFGAFRYLTAGDAGGTATGSYSNIETPIATYLNTTYGGGNFHVCCFKVSHHGSDHSTKTTFLNTINPSSCVIESALQSYNGTRIPVERVVTDLTTKCTLANVYTTYIPEKKKKSTAPDYDKPAADLQDVNMYILGAPATGGNVTIAVFTKQRNKADLKLSSGVGTPTTITCSKAHPDAPGCP